MNRLDDIVHHFRLAMNQGMSKPTDVHSRQEKPARYWACPNCARKFAKRNQWHSCHAQSIGRHFRDKDPELLKLYELLVTRLRRFGPLRIDAVKSSINLVSKFHFGGIAVRRNYLRVGFLSDTSIDDERIVRSEKLGPKRVANSVVLRSPADIDDQLISWLKNAYMLQARRKV